MHYVRGCACSIALMMMAACTHATQSQAPSHASPAPHVQRSGAPSSASPAVSPSATASPPAEPLRALSPRIVKHIVRLPPDAAPKILAVAVSETTVHSGDNVSGSVVTSSNVASVQARVGGYAMPLNKVGVGRFALTYKVNLPWFIRGNFAMRVIATNTRGDTVERVIPLRVR